MPPIGLFVFSLFRFFARARKRFRTATNIVYIDNMVIQCVVFSCSNRQNQAAKDKGISFFRFPKDNKKRRAWIKAINRADWLPNEYSRICSCHFVDGWHSDDLKDENYRPTLFSYKRRVTGEGDSARWDRRSRRNLLQELNEAEVKNTKIKESHTKFSLFSHESYCKSIAAVDDQPVKSVMVDDADIDDVNIKTFEEKGVQCDLDPLLEENIALHKQLDDVMKQLNHHKWGVAKIKDNDAKTKFYTGLPSFAVFLWLFNFLKSKAEKMRYWTGAKTDYTDRQRTSSGSLDLIDQLFAVLIRLRVGLFVSDLSERFHISEGTFSKYFTTWISLMAHELNLLNPFPSREIVDQNMPQSFKIKFPSVRVILDCTEVFIQRSSSLINQSMTFSNYKHHTTVKFLVGITPSGVISFVSEGWPGKTSDRQLTIECGILDLLDENDSVMADKGFTIRDLLEKRKCTLNIPPFRGPSAQFTTEEVFETQEIASLRIHVERSIGRVKTFHILDGIMPLTIQPLVTKIFQVICWLTNLDVPLVN